MWTLTFSFVATSYAAFLLDSLDKNSPEFTISTALPITIPGANSDRSSPILDFDEPELQPELKLKLKSEREVELKAEAQAHMKDEDEVNSTVGQSGSTVAVSSSLLPALRLVAGGGGSLASQHRARAEGGSDSGRTRVDAEDDDFESELAHIFTLQGLETELNDPKSFVMKEKLNMNNGKELLMDGECGISV